MTSFTNGEFSQNHNLFLNKIEQTLKYLWQILEPEKIHSHDFESFKFEEKNLLFEKKSLLSITGLYQAKNAYTIIFKIYKYSILNYPQNIHVEINLLEQLNLLCK